MILSIIAVAGLLAAAAAYVIGRRDGYDAGYQQGQAHAVEDAIDEALEDLSDEDADSILDVRWTLAVPSISGPPLA